MHDCQEPQHRTGRERHGPTVAHAGRLRPPPTVITTRWPPFAPADTAVSAPPFAVCARRPA